MIRKAISLVHLFIYTQKVHLHVKVLMIRLFANWQRNDNMF